MRLVFFGTPLIAVPTLDALVAAGHEIALVVTQPDRRRGRGSATSPSPVKQAAIEHGLPVGHKVKEALDVEAELGVLVAFGRLIKPEILERMKILNLHPSLLPRWRGATPVEAAILAGDEKTGISIMQLGNEMDAGPVYLQLPSAVSQDEPAAQLYERLFELGNKALVSMLAQPELPPAVEQHGDVTYCGKFSSDDFHIDWNASAEHISRLTRVGKPWTTVRGKRLKILSARVVPDIVGEAGALVGTTVVTGEGGLELLMVQPEGKAQQLATAWRNGLHSDVEIVLGEES